MAILLVHHKVEDYPKWRAVFDSMKEIRQSYGVTGATVLRSESDPNEIVIINDFSSLEGAHKYAASSDLREGMKKAGVVSQPEVLFLDQA